MDNLDIIEYKKGICFLCSEKCYPESYVHLECASALELLRKKRIKFLIENYGEGTLFNNKLISWNEAKSLKE